MFGKALFTTFFFFFTCIHTSLSFDLPISSDLSTNPVAAERTGVQCLESRMRSHFANTISCLEAILKLPESPDAGNFHSNAPADTYKLPVYRNHKTCTISISMVDSAAERSTWDHISSVARSVVMICSVGQFPMGSTGGTVYVGMNKRIRIAIEKGILPLGDDGFQNVTATM